MKRMWPGWTPPKRVKFKTVLEKPTLEHRWASPPAAVIAEAVAASEAARIQPPLTYAFGDPLPGRSVLDKMRAS